MANTKEVRPEENRPAQNIPYQEVHEPFQLQFLVPGSGIQMYKDVNGVITIATQGGESVTDIVAGDNIELTRTEDGKIVISAVNSIANITAGQNVSVDVDPDTGDVIISSVIGGTTNEHYQGVFDTTEELIAADPDPANGDYGMVKNLTFSDGETTWDGNYKYCFYISGQWTVVDQMLAFTTDTDLLQQYYSVGGSSPVIYLHKVAQSGSFNDLNNVPIVATPVITVEGQTVKAECATEGAEIWYTTDGSMPHVNGTKYTGPVTVNSATTFRFVGIKNGMINSLEATASADYTLQPPTVSLDWHDGTVTMVNPNEDGNGDPVGTIYYTTDGSTPTSSSTEYTQPFLITAKTTFNMIVVNGGNESSVSTKTYNKVATARTGSPSANWIVNRRNQVYYSITSLDGTEVFYRVTKDGTTPDWNSPEGAGSVSVPLFTESGNPTTVKVASFSVDMVPADILTMELGEGTPDAPSITFDSDTGRVTLARSGNTVSLNLYTMPGSETNNQGCHIYYTLDGSTPTENSTWYTGPFTMPQSGTVKAILVAYRQYSSDVASETIGLLEAPTSSIDYRTGAVTMVNPNSYGTIHYTTDGSTPTSESTEYSGPVTLENTTTLKMIVVNGGMSSPEATDVYEKTPQPVWSMPTFNPDTGIGTILIEGDRQDTKIHYTTDGSTPGPLSPSLPEDGYGTLQIQRFQANPYPKYIGYDPNKIPSNVGVTGPEEQEIPEAPTISVVNGMVRMVNDGWNTYDIQLQTNNNVPTMGCRIYYTLDGSTPTENSTLYTGPFAEPAAGTTIKAILVAYGQYESAVAQYPEVEPYTPDPWLRVTGGRTIFGESVDSGRFLIISDMDLGLESSTDLQNWSDFPMTQVPSIGYVSGEFEEGNPSGTLINSSEPLYIRAKNSNQVGQIIIATNTGICGYSGNAYALVGPTEQDWHNIIHFGVLDGDGYTSHIPDFPADVLPEGETYDSMISYSLNGLDSDILERTTCNVTDDGINLNFHIGITPEDLYDERLIEYPYNSLFADALGNNSGFPDEVNVCASDSLDGILEVWNTLTGSIDGISLPQYFRYVSYDKTLVASNIEYPENVFAIIASKALELSFYVSDNRVDFIPLQDFETENYDEGNNLYTFTGVAGKTVKIINNVKHPFIQFIDSDGYAFQPEPYITQTNGIMAGSKVSFQNEQDARISLNFGMTAICSVSTDGGMSWTNIPLQNGVLDIVGIVDQSIYRIEFLAH